MNGFTTTEIVMLVILMVVIALSIWAQHHAYYNGVVDGYGHGREPRNPGYFRAGVYLRKYMTHRWPELQTIARSSQKYDPVDDQQIDEQSSGEEKVS